jgi:hypothetical protein
MNRKSMTLLVTALSLAFAAAVAQDAPKEPREGGRPQGPEGRPVNPLFAALDANGDREISADELANAATALKALDKNGDGKLTPDEIRGERPARGGGERHAPGAAPKRTP